MMRVFGYRGEVVSLSFASQECTKRQKVWIFFEPITLCVNKSCVNDPETASDTLHKSPRPIVVFELHCEDSL